MSIKQKNGVVNHTEADGESFLQLAEEFPDLGLCLEHEKEKGHDSNGFLKRRTSHKMQVKNIVKERN